MLHDCFVGVCNAAVLYLKVFINNFRLKYGTGPCKYASFKSCKKKFCFWSLQNFLFFKIVPPGTIFRNKIFCRDLFKKQNILQGPKTTKWVQSSCATYTNHHKNGIRDYFKKQKILQGPKTIFFFTGTKT